MKNNNLSTNQVYVMDDELSKSILLIASNRNNPKQIDAKLESCRKTAMLVPAILDDAMNAHEAGYSLLDPLTGNPVEDESVIAQSLTVAEGNTRFRAWLKARKENEADSSKPLFDYKFIYAPSKNGEEFKTKYRNMNMVNEPTKTKEFADDALATEKENKILVSYKKKIDFGLTAKAAGFATIGNEIKKEGLAAIFDGKTPPSYLKNEDDVEHFDAVYDAILDVFSSKTKLIHLLRGTKLWRWTADKMNASTDKAAESKKLVGMFENLKVKDSTRLLTAKAEGGKTAEQVVRDVLDGIYHGI